MNIRHAKPTPRLPLALRATLWQHRMRPGRYILVADVATQTMRLFERNPGRPTQSPLGEYASRRRFLISTSRFGTGQTANSCRTPLGLHRIASKFGAGQPIGTMFRGRRPVGLQWDAPAQATVVHRIFWLEGLQPGFNRGGNLDSYERYIYLHGCADETTLGRPQSRGCVHVGASDLLLLFDRIPVGALVWIA